MQNSILELTYQIINQINILLDSTQHLEDKFRDKIDKIDSKMNEFITNYHSHLSLPTNEFVSYLNHDALSPLTVVVGYAELFRSVYAPMLTPDDIHLLNHICDDLRLLTENLRNERNVMVANRSKLSSI
jgi:hypothetical protein